MLLDHIGETDKAGQIRDAVGAVIEAGEYRAYDMMMLPGGPDVISKGAASTIQLTDAVIAAL
jgi:isocitrate/isopropylmalate dehydrogenase